MLIKSVKVAGFKIFSENEPKQFDFYHNTMIKGENYSGKTSLGDALCWVFTGRSSMGITSDYILRNDNSSKAIVEAVFEDNSGKVHKLKREMSGQNDIINLDDLPIRESELAAFIGLPDVFLSVFMIGYFHRLSPKVAKDLIMGVVPFPSHKSIVNKVNGDVRSYLPEDENFDSNAFLKQKRSELKLIEDEIKRCQGKISISEDKIKFVNAGDILDETELKTKIESLETRKVNLIKLSAQNNSVGFLESKLSLLKMEIVNLKNQKNMFTVPKQRFCPTCRQPVPEEELRKIIEKAEEQNALTDERIEKLENDEKELIKNIEDSIDKSNEFKAIQDELNSVEDELKHLKAEKEKIIVHNQTIKSQQSFVEENRERYETSKIQLDKLSAERYTINRAITAVTEYNAIKADLQYEAMRNSLKDVTIRLQRLNMSTNELRDCFEILYKGREYSQISTSETIKAGLEISSFLNKRTGLKLPVFIDNAESITYYVKPDTQIFEAKVEKDMVLTVIEEI